AAGRGPPRRRPRDRAPLRDQRRATARARPLLSRVLGGDEPEHQRLREPARVPAVRNPARIYAGDPDAVRRAGALVDLHATVGMGDGRPDANAQPSVRKRLGLLRERNPIGDLRPRERGGVELVPGPAAGLGRDRLGEVVLRPRWLAGEELLAEVVDGAREA